VPPTTLTHSNLLLYQNKRATNDTDAQQPTVVPKTCHQRHWRTTAYCCTNSVLRVFSKTFSWEISQNLAKLFLLLRHAQVTL